MKMNKKQLIAIWVMVGCILYTFSCVTIVRGIKPINEQPLINQFQHFIGSYVLVIWVIILVIGNWLISIFKDKKQ